MSEPVHVFIATTQGLVPICGIAQRRGQALPSFVTISESSRVSIITTQYRHFVNADTSPIPAYFKNDSYHMVIGKDIQHGESWQLACAAAHMLHACDKLGNSFVQPGDKVIIASGEIDAVSAKVSKVTHLAQKCLQAQSQIQQWQAMHCQLDFLVPEENYRQALPDITFPLTPLVHILELENHLIARGDLPKNLTLSHEEQFHPPKSLLSGNGESLRNVGRMLSQQVHSLAQSFSKAVTSIFQKTENNLSAKRIAMLASVALMPIVAVLIFLALGSQEHEPTIYMQYQLKTLERCSESERLSAQYTPSAIVSLHTLDLHELCTLSLAFKGYEQAPTQVWLASDSYKLMVLDKLENKEAFNIPLPSWQQASRTYTLIVFSQNVDESDRQSLEAYLKSLYERGEASDALALSAWANKQGLSVRFIQHTLSVA